MGAKGGMRDSVASGGGGIRSPWGRRGSRTGPDSGNANTCDWGSGNIFTGLLDKNKNKYSKLDGPRNPM